MQLMATQLMASSFPEAPLVKVNCQAPSLY